MLLICILLGGRLKQNEAEALIVKMKQLWGNPFKVTSSTAVEWAQHAQHVSYEQMDKAIDYFAAQGDKFPPSLAEVISRAKASDSPRVYESNSRVRVCKYCGGPYYGGEHCNELKAHYKWCPRSNGPLTLHSVHSDIDSAYSDPSDPVVPMPHHLKAKLASTKRRV